MMSPHRYLYSNPKGRFAERTQVSSAKHRFSANPNTSREAEGKLVATAVLCRFSISPRIEENERESKKGMRRRLRRKNGTARRAIPTWGFSTGAAAPLLS
jgi:hypothetical protein